ncbi:uncharacterized protein LOC123869984 isoform X1 [Maniola jurtina]|uniref:uncharacterized protein LOC123869984 isoform X1 n=1 Tax=Maniola jurtina TaxID=191418 RepID=UPI001E688CDF|nr:uncharacterized protein LOC123869984 isoform X1 [Maniola jurtina]XP_045769070.1 uncharacterized protein LOC123869984 isoform X1 [Maniola jurtina]
MTSQTLDVHEEISKIQTSQKPMYDTKSEKVYKAESSCSCPQCDSIDCFKIRYEKGHVLCTCPDCENKLSRKNDTSKKSDEECNREVTNKVEKVDGQRHTLNTDTKCDLPNKKSDDIIYPELTRKDVKKYTQKDMPSATIKHDDMTREKSDDKTNLELTGTVNKKDEQKDALSANIKHDYVNKKSKDESCHDKIKKVVTKDKQKDPVITYIKCDHLNKTNDTKACCKITKKSDNSYEDKDKQNEIDFSYEKSDSKSFCAKSKRGDTPKDYCEIAKKIIEENTLKQHIKTGISKVDLCEHTEFSYKNTTFIKDEVKKRESFKESYVTRNYSVATTYTRKGEKMESDDPTATLSAQVMDLPYEAYKDSLSSHKPINSINANEITKPDILAKLKEIYKACSCKICECIPGYSATYDVSKVKSCGCEDTKHNNIQNNQRDSYNPQDDCVQSPHSGCACYRCDRKDCRGVNKNKMETGTCDCEPCECVKFSKSYTKSCDCEPCQCADCTDLNFQTLRPVIVAPVQGNFQQSLCQCEPCECVHCTHNYGAMASNLMREASTDMASHSNCNCDTCANNSCQFDSDCRCDTHNRIVRKPIDRIMRDYDIRLTSVEDNSFSRKCSVKIENCDTIAMFTFSNNYSNTGFNKSRDNCHCIDCECIICEDNQRYGSRVKNSYEGIPLAFSNLSAKSFTICKCQSCECQLCCKTVDVESDKMLTTRAVNHCGCDICDCISCKGLPYCFENKEINDNSKPSFKNKLIDNEVKTLKDFSNNNISTDYFYPLKKGKLLTPSMFEAKILSNRQFRSQSSLPNVKKLLPSKSILKVNITKSNKKLLSPHNIKICHLKSVNSNFDIACKQPSNKNLLSEFYFSNIDTVQKHCDDIMEYNTISCNTNAKKYVNNIEAPSTSFIFPKKSPAICVDNTINEMNNYDQRNIEANNNEVKLLSSIQIPNGHRTLKGKTNSDMDLFCSRILSFEKSILQIQKDILQSRKALVEICSKNGMPHDNFTKNDATTSFYDVTTGKSLFSIHETKLIDQPEYIENYKEPGIITNSDDDKIREIINNTTTLLDSVDNNLNNDQNDNFSKGDNKMYTKLMKKSHVIANNIRRKRNVARSRVKKLSRYSENKIIDFISDHIKENYRHHGKHILNHKYITKSISTSNDLVAEQQRLKFKEENEYSQTVSTEDIYCGSCMPWSVLQKNLYINHAPVTHKGICTIPELELNITRAVQSTSIETNETQGYAVLTKLQTEVSKLLNSPLLQLKTYLKPDLNGMTEEKTDFKPKSKMDLELKHDTREASSQTRKQTLLVDKETNSDIGTEVEEINMDMTKLVELLLTRTVCKSELTKPFSRIPEKLQVPKIKSVKSASEDLKARFLGLRRVSDHTVLLRWKMPRQVEDVQGYELQVDGRPVQKILSPTRCMAVLTCLPHCEKLVLTIRTLTISQQPSYHRPAATIVYCPREKRSRYHRLNFVEELQ